MSLSPFTNLHTGWPAQITGTSSGTAPAPAPHPAPPSPFAGPFPLPDHSLFLFGLPRLSGAPAAGREAGASAPQRLWSVWSGWISIFLDTLWIHAHGARTDQLHLFPAVPALGPGQDPSCWPRRSPRLESRGSSPLTSKSASGFIRCPGGRGRALHGDTCCCPAGDRDLDPDGACASAL